MTRWNTWVLFSLVLWSSAYVVAAPYTIAPLPFPSGTLPRAINNHGHVVGRFEVETGDDYHAFLYSKGVFQDLGTLGGDTSEAYALNDSDEVVGAAAGIEPGNRVFRWSATEGMRDLGLGYSYGISNSGLVAGSSNSANGIVHAFVWDRAGRAIDLGTLGGPSSQALGINDAGEAVGSSGTTPVNSPHQAFVWNSASGIRQLETSSVWSSHAASINNLSQAVGTIEGEAVLWTSSGDLVQLGRLTGNYSSASAINDQGQIVGSWFENHPASPERAFLWDSVDGMQDLMALLPPDSGWTHLFNAEDINEHGQIVGIGQYNGDISAYLMTPIPEPRSLLIGMAGLVTLTIIAIAAFVPAR